MVVDRLDEAPSQGSQLSARDAAIYLFDMGGQLAAMADEFGLSRVAAAFELARAMAAEAVAATHPGMKPAPEETT